MYCFTYAFAQNRNIGSLYYQYAQRVVEKVAFPAGSLRARSYRPGC